MEKPQVQHKLFNFVIGLSGPYGSGCSSLAEELVKIINDWPGCYCARVQVSNIINSAAKDLHLITNNESLSDAGRRKMYQEAGNALRKERKEIIAELIADEIRVNANKIERIEETDWEQTEKKKNELEQIGTFIYVVDSLKNINDLKSLRDIYKDEFFFCFVTANNEIRWRRMRDYRSWKEEQKAEFQKIDAIDSDEQLIHSNVGIFGQQVKKLASYADYYFVNNATREDLKKTAYRMVSYIFGLGINQPSKDEKSMHIAFSSANQSACLSRQVGAAIFTKEGNILSIGHNDVPKPEGGLYSIDDNDHDNRCLNVGDRRCINDTNKEERFHDLANDLNTELKKCFSETLLEDHFEQLEPMFDRKEIYNLLLSIVKKSEFKDATEYCRAVHAEMDALLAVCRNLSGSTIGSTVYVTTQPCHNCVKHLIAAGVERVVYIEPYPKSLGEELHSDAITMNPQSSETSQRKISFLPYQGFAPRRYHDIFDKVEKRKDSKGKMCYKSKQEMAFHPMFAQKVTKRSRIVVRDQNTDQTTINEIEASTNVVAFFGKFKEGGTHDQGDKTSDSSAKRGVATGEDLKQSSSPA